MADFDILTDKLRNLLENNNFQEAYSLIKKLEMNDDLASSRLDHELLILISKIYFYNNSYTKAKEYLARYELQYPDRCLEIEFINQKYKLLILEKKAKDVIALIESAISEERPEEEEYWLVFYLGKAHFWNGDYVKADGYLQKCYRFYLESNNHYMLGLTLYMLGYFSAQRNLYNQAEEYLVNAIKNFEKADRNYQIGHCYHLMCIQCYRNGKYEDALENLNLAERYYKNQRSKNSMINSSIARARISIFKGDYDHSEEILKSTFREARQVNYKRAQALSAEFLGEINYRKGNYHEAEAWLEKALELAKESAPRGDVAVEVYRRLGDVKTALGELDEAEEMLSEAHKLCEHLGDKYELGSVYRAMGVVSVMRDDIDLARSFFNESITTHKMIGEKFELASTCKVAAGHYLDWSRGDDVADVIREKLIQDAHNLAVEAMHLYSSIKLNGRADECRKLISEIGRKRGAGTDSVKTVEISFRPEWLHRDTLVARSEDMKAVITEVEQLAGTDIPIFVSGETGTGKEVVARLIHKMSGRDSAPFVAVNCASVADTVFESELFGHCKGAFTGADQDRIGLIEKAHGGTLFLDEVSSMPLEQQAKILRVLEDGKVRRVGETRDRRVDIRVLSASNGNIDRMIEKGHLRKDFYYRIAAKRINLKPLRERQRDIEPLLAYYICSSGKEFRLEEGIKKALHNYFWPGNVRELVNLLRVLVNVREKNGIIYLRDLPTYIRDCTFKGTSSGSLSFEIRLFQSKIRNSSLSANEKERIEKLIKKLLSKHSGNKTATARELGISRKTLYRYLDKLDISPLH